MRIAVVTDDQVTISRHFGRAHYYLVFTVQDGEVTAQELRSKLGHDQFRHEKHHEHDGDHHEHTQEGHGYGRHAQEKHERMMANLGDCQVLLCGGMGMGAHQRLREMGITPVLTSTRDIQAAVKAYLAGTLENEEKRLH